MAASISTATQTSVLRITDNMIRKLKSGEYGCTRARRMQKQESAVTWGRSHGGKGPKPTSVPFSTSSAIEQEAGASRFHCEHRVHLGTSGLPHFRVREVGATRAALI